MSAAMYRTILVGYDGREGGRDALALASGLAAIEGAELLLAAALELDPLATPADAYERAMAEAEERLSSRGTRASRRRRRFRLRTIGGVSAPRALHEVAEDEDADVIVLGSTHRHGLGRVLPGSVGERLATRRPVRGTRRPKRLRIRGESSRSASIGVGYDGRAESSHARDVAAALAEDLGAEVRTITVGEDEGEPAEVARRALARTSTCWSLARAGYGPLRHALMGNVSWGVMRAASLPGAGRPALGQRSRRLNI